MDTLAKELIQACSATFSGSLFGIANGLTDVLFIDFSHSRCWQHYYSKTISKH
jgi:hypothetical protein